MKDRINFEDALKLYDMDIFELGILADARHKLQQAQTDEEKSATLPGQPRYGYRVAFIWP